MGRLIKWVVLLGVLWAGWWFAASSMMAGGLNDWLDDRRAEGWQAETAGIAKSGFPLRLTNRLQDPALTDPETGITLSAPYIDVSAAAYWPGFVRVDLPDAPITLGTAASRAQLLVGAGTAGLRLHPGTSLQLQSMIAQADGASVQTDQGTLLSSNALRVAMQQDETTPQTYHIDIQGNDVTPGKALRDALFLPSDWPLAFDALQADLSMTLDRPLDRSAIETARPQPRAITMRKTEIIWGKLNLFAAGDLEIDAKGIPTGTLNLRADNWRDLLVLAETSGTLPSGMRGQAETLLGALAGMSGDPNTIDLDIKMQNGRMQVGFIPLGNAPRIFFP